ncbi:hypothetical protein GCM10009095_24670 [Sphingomonas molluscorum]
MPLSGDDRPDPDALLRQAAQEGRGRLKIFLGAAPGVGKTYEMLSEGAARRRDGVDVVVAVVETHGRAETEALVRGHEVIPRRDVPYEGRTLREMDLDAVLARAPRLALVDELAHTMRRAAGTPNVIRMSRSCWRPGSTSTPPSTSSTWKA